jgi:hypothetical protein
MELNLNSLTCPHSAELTSAVWTLLPILYCEQSLRVNVRRKLVLALKYHAIMKVLTPPILKIGTGQR